MLGAISNPNTTSEFINLEDVEDYFEPVDLSLDVVKLESCIKNVGRYLTSERLISRGPHWCCLDVFIIWTGELNSLIKTCEQSYSVFVQKERPLSYKDDANCMGKYLTSISSY